MTIYTAGPIIQHDLLIAGGLISEPGALSSTRSFIIMDLGSPKMSKTERIVVVRTIFTCLRNYGAIHYSVVGEVCTRRAICSRAFSLGNKFVCPSVW